MSKSFDPSEASVAQSCRAVIYANIGHSAVPIWVLTKAHAAHTHSCNKRRTLTHLDTGKARITEPIYVVY